MRTRSDWVTRSVVRRVGASGIGGQLVRRLLSSGACARSGSVASLEDPTVKNNSIRLRFSEMSHLNTLMLNLSAEGGSIGQLQSMGKGVRCLLC
jgi:hypothetical protein